jgi:hypothetical protein
VIFAACSSATQGATPKEIDRAIKGGTDALKARYGGPGGPPATAGFAEQGLGGTCLAGLALLEAGVPVTDASIKNITAIVRDASYKQKGTYQVALCLMYLDRLGDPNDVPLIQMLAVRLMVGQTPNGGWGYQCVEDIPNGDEQRLRESFKQGQLVAGKEGKDGPKLHPEVEKYGQALIAARNRGMNLPGAALGGGGDDNSNTQFAVLAVWMARKHGVPVDGTLELIEKRFMSFQDARTGNWPYSGPLPGAIGGGMASSMPGSPSMYCAGLVGMATSVARREERKLKSDTPAPAPKQDTKPKTDTKPNDPFYNPPGGKELPKGNTPARPADARDLVVQRAFAGLGLTMAEQIRSGRGLLVANNTTMHGNGDLYFLWSLERVGVIYGIDKIGGLDWYDLGSTVIVRSQGNDGSWTIGGYGQEVNTAFAVLFLCRSNLARDLSSKVQKDPTSTEMRAGTGPSANDLLPNRPTTPTNINPLPTINLPNPTGDEAITLASKMLKANGSEWAKLLAETRDAKGALNTRALLVTATNAEGDRKLAAREALAERLCRMTPATLRAMMKDDNAELRRAAALACAMKDDKDHIPDLIALITDTNDSVTRAAKASLRSLTGKDFGPATNANASQKQTAAAAWTEWYKEKK